MKQLLTHSRIEAFKCCRKKHWFSYEQKIRSVEDAKALRMGSAFHDAIELIATRADDALTKACHVIRRRYEHCPFPDELEWRYEEETLLRLACGYDWRWLEDGLDYLATEHEFRLKLRNPETKYASTAFDLGGKIDGIVKLPDGRLAVKESKLYGEAIEPDADMWRRMRFDHQVTLYVLAARELGYNVDCVLYDVARKPTIKPNAVPVLDELLCKIVLDANGQRVRNASQKTWRQTADTKRGWTIQTRPMDVTEWGDKLMRDIIDRFTFYFSRVEIPRLENDLAEFENELWDIQKTIRDAQFHNRWYRTATKNTCPWCEYFDLCSTGWKIGDQLPERFRQAESSHEELKGETT